jgi:hypothetical protein
MGGVALFLFGTTFLMRALIVYESLFGNTREVTFAVAEGIRDAC